MIDLLATEKELISRHIIPGGVCADFTMGNGHDTLWLSGQMGEEGHVYAFDIQEAAVASTAKRLKEVNCPENYTLICDSHHNVKKYVEGPIKAGMFNLGWLPGGDKTITTMRETTLPAIEAAIDLLGEDAILNIAVYPGHPEGDAEGKMIEEMLSGISRFKVCATKVKIVNSESSPYFFMIETKAKKN